MMAEPDREKEKHYSRRPRSAGITMCLLCAIFIMVLCAQCSPPEQQLISSEGSSVRICFVGDLQGYIEECG